MELLWDSHGRRSWDVVGKSSHILIFLGGNSDIFRCLLWQFDMLLFESDSGDFLYILEAILLRV